MSRVNFDSINSENINNLQTTVDDYTTVLNNAVSDMVNEYCQPLDEYMTKVRELLGTGSTITDEQLDDITLTIPTLLYFVSESQEIVGLKEDVAKAIKNDKYYNLFKSAEGTIADKTAFAENDTQEETLVNMIYSSAYKKIKLRCELALETLQSVKKVISRRIQSFEQSNSDSPVRNNYNNRQKL